MRSLGAASALAAVSVFLVASPAVSTDDPTFLQAGLGRANVRVASLANFSMRALATNPFDMPDIPANDPTVGGATIRFYELTNAANQVTFTMPAAGWSKRGNDPLNPTALKYRGTGTPGDPCRVVVVKPRGVRAVCTGADVTLNGPFANPFLGVTLSIGSGPKKYCPGYYAIVNHPGFVRGTPAIVSYDLLCSPSGAFLDE
jgi:hypothetical protein